MSRIVDEPYFTHSAYSAFTTGIQVKCPKCHGAGVVTADDDIIPLPPPYNKDDSGLPPLPGILAEHFKKPLLDLTVALVLFLWGKNGREIMNGNRPVAKNRSPYFTFIFDLRLHKIPPMQ